MNIMQGQIRPAGGPRRTEALAFIIERIVRSGTSPSSGDIGRKLAVSRTRAQQLVDELIREGVLSRTHGSRGLQIRDVSHCRHIIVEHLRGLGLVVADPMEELRQPLSHSHLPILPPFEHIPDPE